MRNNNMPNYMISGRLLQSGELSALQSLVYGCGLKDCDADELWQRCITAVFVILSLCHVCWDSDSNRSGLLVAAGVRKSADDIAADVAAVLYPRSNGKPALKKCKKIVELLIKCGYIKENSDGIYYCPSWTDVQSEEYTSDITPSEQAVVRRERKTRKDKGLRPMSRADEMAYVGLQRSGISKRDKDMREIYLAWGSEWSARHGFSVPPVDEWEKYKSENLCSIGASNSKAVKVDKLRGVDVSADDFDDDDDNDRTDADMPPCGPDEYDMGDDAE